MDNINYNEERKSYSFYSLKEKPWHGLGTIVEKAKTPDEILHIANMDYEVGLAKMYASFIPDNIDSITKHEDYYKCLCLDGNSINIPKKGDIVPDIYATYRKDNYDVLGTVGKRYEVVQNEVAMDFIYQVCKNNDMINKNDIIIQTAGVLGKGERIFVTAKLPNYNIGKDDVERYILFTTSHDGSASINACFTNIRVVCNNTLNAALHKCTNKMTFKHTKNILNNLQEGAVLMNKSIHYNQSIKQLLEHTQTINTNSNDVERYIANILFDEGQVKYIVDKGGIDRIPFDDKNISSIKHNQFIAYRDYIENGVGQDVYRGTAYWMYNGVLSYINNGMKYKNQQDKFDSITQGQSFKIAQKAMNELIRIAA